MKILQIKKLLILTILLSSCSDTLDFNQLKDLKLNPIYDVSLIYFTVKQSDFLVNGIELTTVSDITRFTTFENKFFRNNLLKAAINFEIENRFNRKFTIDFDFLDANNKVVYSFSQLLIPARERKFKQTQNIDITTNPLVLTSKKMKITIHLLQGVTPLDPHVKMFLLFKTSGKFYIGK